MRTSLTLLVIALSALVLTACGDDSAGPSLVTGPRVLAIKAEPPEVSPGSEVELTALVVGPGAENARLRWRACLLDERGSGFFEGGSSSSSSGGGGYSIGDPGECQEGSENFQDLGVGATATLKVPSDFLEDPSRILAAYDLPPELELPPEALTGLLTVAGINLTVTLTVTVEDDEGEQRIDAYKRVNVSLAPEQNRNPIDLAFALSLEGDEDDAEVELRGAVSEDGSCLVAGQEHAITAETWTFRALNIPDPQVSYPVLVGGSSVEEAIELTIRDEVYFYSFFSTVGSFEEDIIKSKGEATTSWDLSATKDTSFPLWIVARDGRGGTHWCASELTLR